MTRLEDRIRLRDVIRPGVVMILGESVNYLPGESHAPWCTMRGCSGWLMDLLDQSNIPEERLYWDNVVTESGTQTDLRGLVGLWNPSNVVALGNLADQNLISVGIPHFKVVHPQYWMRFRRKFPYPGVKLLKYLASIAEVKNV